MNNKGFSIIELVLSFSLLAVVLAGLINYSLTYNTKSEVEEVKTDIIDFKNAVTKAIYDDILNNQLITIEKGSTFYFNGVKSNSLYHYANAPSFGGVYFTAKKTEDKNNTKQPVNTTLNSYVLSNSNKSVTRELIIKVVDENGDIGTKGLYLIYGNKCSSNVNNCITFKVPESDVSKNKFISQVISTDLNSSSIGGTNNKIYSAKINFMYYGVGIEEPLAYNISFSTMS